MGMLTIKPSSKSFHLEIWLAKLKGQQLTMLEEESDDDLDSPRLSGHLELVDLMESQRTASGLSCVSTHSTGENNASAEHTYRRLSGEARRIAEGEQHNVGARADLIECHRTALGLSCVSTPSTSENTTLAENLCGRLSRVVRSIVEGEQHIVGSRADHCTLGYDASFT